MKPSLKNLLTVCLTAFMVSFGSVWLNSMKADITPPKKGAEKACYIPGKGWGKMCDFQSIGSCKKYKKCTLIEL